MFSPGGGSPGANTQYEGIEQQAVSPSNSPLRSDSTPDSRRSGSKHSPSLHSPPSRGLRFPRAREHVSKEKLEEKQWDIEQEQESFNSRDDRLEIPVQGSGLVSFAAHDFEEQHPRTEIAHQDAIVENEGNREKLATRLAALQRMLRIQ